MGNFIVILRGFLRWFSAVGSGDTLTYTRVQFKVHMFKVGWFMFRAVAFWDNAWIYYRDGGERLAQRAGQQRRDIRSTPRLVQGQAERKGDVACVDPQVEHTDAQEVAVGAHTGRRDRRRIDHRRIERTAPLWGNIAKVANRGPAAVVLTMRGPWTLGALANHVWSVAGDSDRQDISNTFLQPFAAYTWPNAWTVSVQSESTYNWKTEKWSVPINFAVSKLVRWGKLPVSLQAGVTYVDATLANTDIAVGGADALWADGDDGTTGGTTTDNAQDTINDPADDWNASDWTTTAVLANSTYYDVQGGPPPAPGGHGHGQHGRVRDRRGPREQGQLRGVRPGVVPSPEEPHGHLHRAAGRVVLFDPIRPTR